MLTTARPAASKNFAGAKTMTTETNIYPILNLSGLHARFRVYRVKGLRPEQPEFHQNCQQLRRALARALGFRPMEVLNRAEGALVALAEDCPEPPDQIMLIRAQVAFEKLSQGIDVDFGHLTPETETLALR